MCHAPVALVIPRCLFEWAFHSNVPLHVVPAPLPLSVNTCFPFPSVTVETSACREGLWGCCVIGAGGMGKSHTWAPHCRLDTLHLLCSADTQSKGHRSNKTTTTTIFTSSLLGHRISITSGAPVSSEQNQTATLRHTHTHTHTRTHTHTPHISHPQRP